MSLSFDRLASTVETRFPSRFFLIGTGAGGRREPGHHRAAVVAESMDRTIRAGEGVVQLAILAVPSVESRKLTEMSRACGADTGRESLSVVPVVTQAGSRQAMRRRVLQLSVIGLCAAAVCASLGWHFRGPIKAVLRPIVPRFLLRQAFRPPRSTPVEPVAEIASATVAADRQPVAYGSASDDAPGWRAVANVASAASNIGPWRGSDTPLWRIPIEGEGTASPIVVGDRVYLTIADAGPTLWLASFDFETGEERWRHALSRRAFPPRHGKTSDAASTPCSDGHQVFVAHATTDGVELSAVGSDGTPLWSTPLGPAGTRWGFSMSPAWANGLVVVGADNAENGFLAAVDGETGRIEWRRRRPQADDASYSSPVIRETEANIPGATEVILAGLARIEAYALADGRLLWGMGGISNTSGATAAVVGDICVASSGFPDRALVALRIGCGDGGPSVLWRSDRDSEVPYVPSTVVYDGRLYVIHDEGLASCRDLITGKVRWKQRVGGMFTASPTLVRGELLCIDEAGRGVLLGLGDGKIKHDFQINAGCFASPVVVRGRLLIRTATGLVCFALAREPS